MILGKLELEPLRHAFGLGWLLETLSVDDRFSKRVAVLLPFFRGHKFNMDIKAECARRVDKRPHLCRD